MKKNLLSLIIFLATSSSVLLIFFLTPGKPQKRPPLQMEAPKRSLAANNLNQAFKKYIKSRHLYNDVIVSIIVSDLNSAKELAQINPQFSHTPASAVKVFTAMAAFQLLGPQYRFQTKFYYHNKTLYIVGSGDSFLQSKHLKQAVKNIIGQGIKDFSGGIVYDDSLFKTQHMTVLDPSYARHLFAPPSALTLNYNSIKLGVSNGDPARAWALNKTRYARIRTARSFRYESSTKAAHPRMIIRKYPWGDRYLLKGKFTKWNRIYGYFNLAVSRPGLYAATVLNESLKEAGGHIKWQIKRGQVPKQAKLVYTHKSGALQKQVAELCKHSNNVVAKNICLSIGAASSGQQATMANGVEGIKKVLVQLGLKPDKFSLVDPSGLSRQNRFTARQFITVMVNGAQLPWYKALWNSLSIQGHDSHSRKVKPPAHIDIREKSGTLSATGVNTVVGYFHNQKSGAKYAFAILASKKRPGRKIYSGTYTNPLLRHMIKLLDAKTTNVP